MIRRFALLVICMLTIAACDSGSAPPARTAGTSNGSFRPFDLENAPPAQSGMILSGALDQNTGEVVAYAMRRSLPLPSHLQIDINTRSDYILRLLVQTDTPAGEYPITTPVDANPPAGEFSAGLLNLWNPDEAQQYMTNPQGTVTIDYAEYDYVIGSYSLTVENLAGETVNIEGQYYAKEVDFIEN